MTYQVITAPSIATYLNQIPEYLEDLPDNCYLDKTATGTGGTTHALTNEVPYIIAVPFIALVQNKSAQHSNALAVYSKVTNEEILEYISKGGKKIIATYDALPRLENLLDVSTFKLLIDEAHKLVEYGADFKPHVVLHILQNYTKYKSYVFMTATPTREEFLPDEIADVQKIRVIWNNSTPVKIAHQRCNLQFDQIVTNICLDHYREIKEGNAHLFYNSVRAIVKTVKTLTKIDKNLNHTNIRIVCAKTDANLKTVKNVLGKNWFISDPLDLDENNNVVDNQRVISFYTATAFEGTDLYDTNGVTYVISDGRKIHTKLDITTQVSQIIGRIRNSVYNNTVYMLWTHSPIQDCTTETDYRFYVDEEEADAKLAIDDFDSAKSKITKKALVDGTLTNPFFIDNSDEDSLGLLFNTVAVKALMNAFIGMELTYNVINNSQYNDNDLVVVSLKDIFTVLESQDIFKPLSGTDKLKLGRVANFKKICEQYVEAIIKKDEDTKMVIESELNYKDLVDFVEVFGPNKIAATDYRLKNMQEELAKYRLYKESPDSLRKQLRFTKGSFQPKAKVKDMFNKLFEENGINRKAKSTDIEKLYTVRTTIRNGIHGYVIIDNK